MFKVLQWNCRSLSRPKVTYLKSLVDKYIPDVLVICETWISEEKNCFIEGYDMFFTVPSKHQGIAIISKRGSAVKFFKTEDPCIIAINIKIDKNQIFVIGAYFQERRKRELLSKVNYFINRINRTYKNPNIILAGDLNTNTNLKIEEIED